MATRLHGKLIPIGKTRQFVSRSKTKRRQFFSISKKEQIWLHNLLQLMVRRHHAQLQLDLRLTGSRRYRWIEKALLLE
jgi:hypothetical protein